MKLSPTIFFLILFMLWCSLWLSAFVPYFFIVGPVVFGLLITLVVIINKNFSETKSSEKLSIFFTTITGKIIKYLFSFFIICYLLFYAYGDLFLQLIRRCCY